MELEFVIDKEPQSRINPNADHCTRKRNNAKCNESVEMYGGKRLTACLVELELRKLRRVIKVGEGFVALDKKPRG